MKTLSKVAALVLASAGLSVSASAAPAYEFSEPVYLYVDGKLVLP